jgi:DNA-binding protein HU-beta
MNKAELIEKIAGDMETTKAAAGRMLECVFDNIEKGMATDGEVKVSGFGTFLKREKKARVARNPKTGGTVNVPAKSAPAFKAASALKEAIAESK